MGWGVVGGKEEDMTVFVLDWWAVLGSNVVLMCKRFDVRQSYYITFGGCLLRI